MKHGMSYDPSVAAEYGSWREMRRRCLSPKHKRYADYGGRGLGICDEWSDFEVFLKDMGPKPPGRSLDRIPPKRRTRRWITVDGERMTLTSAAKALGLPYAPTYYAVAHKGWNFWDWAHRCSLVRRS